MRTTLTLDPDVAERMRQEMKAGRLSLKQVVNDRLRIGFGLSKGPSRKRFRVTAHRSGFRAGIDPERLNQVVDELEVDAVSAKMRGSAR